MKELFVFYIVLAFLIVLLIFTVLLYSDHHSRTIAPGLLTGNYPLVAVTNSYQTMRINVDASQVAGSISFGNGTANDAVSKISFIPIAGDEERKMNGTFILLLGSDSVENSIFLRVKDLTDGEVIGDESEFFIPDINTWGLTPIRLNFSSKQTSALHDIVVEIKSNTDINAGDLVLNSAYLNYF